MDEDAVTAGMELLSVQEVPLGLNKGNLRRARKRKGARSGCASCQRGRLKRVCSARAVQLFGRLAVVGTHTLWYFGRHCCLALGFDALGI